MNTPIYFDGQAEGLAFKAKVINIVQVWLELGFIWVCDVASYTINSKHSTR